VRKQQPKKKRRDKNKRLMTYFKVLCLLGHVRSLPPLLWKWTITLGDAVTEMMTLVRMNLSKNYLTDLTDRVGPWMNDRVGTAAGHADKVTFSINPDIEMIGISKVLGK